MRSLSADLARSIIGAALLGLLGMQATAQIHEMEILLAGDAQVDDAFGVTVSMSGDRIVVGAVAEYRPGAAGAAYVFEYDGVGSWPQVAKLVASDGEAGDVFGPSAVSGDYIVVGAGCEDSGGVDAGAAYMFEYDGGVWSEVGKLMASDPQADDWFGAFVSITDGRAIVAAPYKDTGGIDGGAAYVFERDGTGTWTEAAKLVAGDPEPDAWFGQTVYIDGDRAVVGAPREDALATDAGAVYVFERDAAGSWTPAAKLVASDGEADSRFGVVSLSGDRLIVGAPFHDSGAMDAGAAYIFERDGAGTWTEVARLVAGDRQAGDWFGNSVSLEGDQALVGAMLEDALGPDAGAAYVFERNASGEWIEKAKLHPSEGQAGDWFGTSVAMGPDGEVVGAPFHDFGGWNAGAAYCFESIGVSVEIVPERIGLSLDQNLPNPFNSGTTIRYTLPDPEMVRLEVIDMLGRRVAVLANGIRDAGLHLARFDAAGLPAGLYMYRLEVGGNVRVRSMVAVK